MSPEARAARIEKLKANSHQFTTEERSALSKALWQDPEWRRAATARAREHLARPEIRAKALQNRIGHKRKPEFGARISAHARARWAAYSVERKAEILHNAWAAQTKTVSSLERAVHEALRLASVPFEPQRKIGPYFVDIYLPEQNRVIECDGAYWHSKPAAANFDRRRDSYLRNHGFSIVRLSEAEIKADADAAVRRALAC